MFFKANMSLDDFLLKYNAKLGDTFALAKVMDSFPLNTKKYKEQLQTKISFAIQNQNGEQLELLLALAWRDGLDLSYKPILKQVILSTWHSCHEDIVEYVGELKDDSFTEDLFEIAKTEFPYRQYDDENEATLRKCIHAFKAINSPASLEKIKLLLATGNANVSYALELYN